MTTTQVAPSVPTKRLAAPILSTDSTFTLNNILSWDGTNNLVAGDFGTTGRGVFRSPDNTQIEFFTFDPSTIASSAITINARGLDYKGGTTDGIKTKYNWPANSTLVELGSNPPAEEEDYVDKSSDETIAGIKTFSSSPIVPTPTSATDAANKSYTDSGLLQGGADASTTVKGIGRLAASPNVTKGTATITIASPAVITFNSHGLTANDTIQFTTTGALPTGLAASTTYFVISTGLAANTFQIAATLGGTAINTSGSQSGTHTLIKTTPIFVGDNDTRVGTAAQVLAAAGDNTDIAVGSGNKFVTQTGLQHNAEKYAVDSVGTDTYAITLSPVPTSYTTGMVVHFKAGTANTGTASLNVNSLGAKTIKKYSEGALAILADNDILAAQAITVMYESTADAFILQSPIANTPNSRMFPKTITTTKDMSTTTTSTIAHGLGITPKFARITINKEQASSGTLNLSMTFTMGTYDGTTQASIYTAVSSNGSTASTSRDSTHAVHYAFGATAGADSDILKGTMSWDATNITITWAATNSPTGTGNIHLEVFA